MGPSFRLFLYFLLCGGPQLCRAQRLWLLPDGTPSPRALSSSVEVECLEAELVVTVSRDLFGTGKLVQPGDLTLGSEGCQPLVSVGTDVVRFQAQLHECSSKVQVRLSELGLGERMLGWSAYTEDLPTHRKTRSRNILSLVEWRKAPPTSPACQWARS